MKRIVNIIFSCLFTALLICVFSFTLSNMKIDYSFFENRKLAAMPEADSDGLSDGSFFDGAEDALVDHAYLRDSALAAGVRLKLDILHLPVVNNIVAKEDRLLYFYNFGFFDKADMDTGSAAERAAAESRAAENCGGRYIYVGVPSQLTYFAEEYPEYMEHGKDYTDRLYKDFFGGLEKLGVDYINMRSVFADKGNNPGYYAQTDHHYSFDGAYLVYGEIISRLSSYGLDVRAIEEGDDYTRVTLPNPFIGSRNRRLYGLFPNTDSVSYADLKIKPELYIQSDGGEYDSLYKLPSDDSEPVTYDFYMYGDHAETIVKNSSVDNGLKALVCGSSYTNAVEAFLCCSFSETRSIDLRYYKAKTLEEYISSYRPDVVIMIFDDGEFVRRAYD